MTTEKGSIEIEGKLKFEEFLHKNDRIANQYFAAILIATTIIIGFNTIVKSSFDSLKERPVSLIIVIGAAIFGTIFGAWLSDIQAFITIKKKFEASNISEILIYTINSEAIIRQTEKNLLNLYWTDVYNVKEYSDMFKIYLNINKSIYFIPKNRFSCKSNPLKVAKAERRPFIEIPKRFFQNESDILYFRELVKKNVRFKKFKGVKL